MLLMLAFGIYGIAKLNRQSLPDFSLGIVTISVEWPGASPQDVEANILEAIEPEVRFLQKVKRVDSTAFEGRGEVTISYEDDANMSKALTDVQAAVARIAILPMDSEKPLITQNDIIEKVCRIEITGPFSEQALKLAGKRVRDDLLGLGLSQVTIVGGRETEIWAELTSDTLRRLELTIDEIAQRVDDESIDLPAGSVESGGMSMQIRSEALARTASELGEVEIIAEQAGQKLDLQDIADIHETFKENSVSHILDGNKAIGMVVYRAGGVDSVAAQTIVTEYLGEIQQQLPPTLRIAMYDIAADQVTKRVDLLIRNGASGMLLVLAMLFMFLNWRIAFWVAMGIPVAIMASLGGMAVLGVSINTISMFAMIMGLGIIVDDAVVVGEHIEHLHRNGLPADVASLHGARMMVSPVMAAVLTTMAAFAPLLAIGSQVGMILRDLPIVIIVLLFFSVLECFLILPMHLKHSLQKIDDAPPRPPTRFQIAFNRFRDTTFRNAVTFAFERRYSTLLATVMMFAIAGSLLASGRVGFEMFSSAETNIVFANFSLTPGTSRDRTEEMVNEMTRAARVAEDRLTNGEGGLISFEVGSIGTGEARVSEPALFGDHVGAYVIELVSGDEREVRTLEFIREWEAEIDPVAGTQQLTIFEQSVTPGRDVDIRISGAELHVMKQAAVELRRRLREIPGAIAVEDNLPFGKQEIFIELTPAGRAMGFTTQDVSRQVRNAFEGAIAKRFSRDQEEVIVRIKLKESDELAETIRDLYLRTPDGTYVPLTEVVSLTTRVGFSQIRRENGLRQVSVTANVDASVATPNQVLNTVRETISPAIQSEFGVEIDFKGQAADQAEAFGDMGVAGTLAIVMMYSILAWVFQSYSTPLLVMIIIPFGFIGAIVGHYVMGFNMTMMSTQAFMGLAGVLVNDSILLVATIKRSMASGGELADAVLNGACERLRPIILTTLTTIAGLAPLLLERSLQAQLVQPLAVTLVFGLLISPYLVLMLVPALLGIGSDIGLRRGGVSMQMTVGPASDPVAGTT